MHHFIYPSKDTYITNRPGYADKNFGINELLLVGTSNTPVRYLSSTKDYYYVNTIFNSQQVDYFSGSFVGTLNDTSSFSGSLVGFNGCLTGTGSGVDVRNEQNYKTTSTQYTDRSLLKFDLTSISSSLASGAISAPKFFLNLKVCNEYSLPISYTIYALPISQSWDMGDGYESDEGSYEGVNWWYRDNDLETEWFTGSVTTPKEAVDFINNPSLATASFKYGGGTWWTGSVASQSFAYDSSDIKMDVTDIVMQWISASIPNEGLILVTSDELISTGSGFALSFYSRDTNTIYSPYLDAMWSDATFTTGSITTGSVTITTVAEGISASIASGSSFEIAGGISGSFSGSSYINTYKNYVTASNLTSSYYVHEFTGSFSGSFEGTASYATGSVVGTYLIFYADYFNGLLDSTASVITSGSVSASLVYGAVEGQISSSIAITSFSGSLTGSALTSSTLNFVTGTINGYYLDEVFLAFSGFLSCIGTSPNIDGENVFGNVMGLLSISSSMVYYPDQIHYDFPTTTNQSPYVVNYASYTSPYNEIMNRFYYWTGDTWGGGIGLMNEYPVTQSCGAAHKAQAMFGTFTSGVFSGSHFVAYYENYKIAVASLSGSLTEAAMLGATVSIPLPSGIDPYAYAYVVGNYINGTAMGTYTISGSNGSPDTASAGANSASFTGQFIDGMLIGGYLTVQLTGSVFTSSYQYTSSVELSASYLTALDTSKPFVATIQNLKDTYKLGDMPRISVFGRKQFPLKYFGKLTQQEQYLVPELLPTSSFYALKDNQTDEIVIDFDNYTQIGCEYPEGNYFTLDTTGLPVDRYYRILVRIDDGQSIYTIDSGKTFKLTR